MAKITVLPGLIQQFDAVTPEELEGVSSGSIHAIDRNLSQDTEISSFNYPDIKAGDLIIDNTGSVLNATEIRPDEGTDTSSILISESGVSLKGPGNETSIITYEWNRKDVVLGLNGGWNHPVRFGSIVDGSSTTTEEGIGVSNTRREGSNGLFQFDLAPGTYNIQYEFKTDYEGQRPTTPGYNFSHWAEVGNTRYVQQKSLSGKQSNERYNFYTNQFNFSITETQECKIYVNNQGKDLKMATPNYSPVGSRLVITKL